MNEAVYMLVPVECSKTWLVQDHACSILPVHEGWDGNCVESGHEVVGALSQHWEGTVVDD